MATLVFSYKDAAERQIRLAAGRTTLGRRPYNGVVLIHPTVSGEHAVLQLDGPQARIEDMGSTNGTWVNGVRVQQQMLATGDRIALGACRARFVAGEHADALPAAAEAAHACLRVLNGRAQGRELWLTKPVVTLGQRGVCVVALQREAQGHQMTWLKGELAPEVNGIALQEAPVRLSHRDRLRLGRTQMVYLQA